MNQKRLYDAAMIFIIGISPLGFQYLKQHVESTNLIQKIQNDIDQHQAKQKSLFIFKPQILVNDLMQNEQKPRISQEIDKRVNILRQWKNSSTQKYLAQVFSIAGFHTIGGLIYPSAFFLSILSYFIIYQMNFVNEYFILNGKQSLFKQSSFQFEKINKLYLYLGLSGIGIAGLSKGIGKLNKRAFDKHFK